MAKHADSSGKIECIAEYRTPGVSRTPFFTDADILRQKKGVAYPPQADSDARKAYPPQADSRRHGRRLFIE